HLPRRAQPRVLRSFPTRRSSDLPVFGNEDFLRAPERVHEFRCPVQGFRPYWEIVDGSFRVSAREGDVAPARRAIGSHDVDYRARSEEHTSELQSRENLVCRLLLE